MNSALKKFLRWTHVVRQNDAGVFRIPRDPADDSESNDESKALLTELQKLVAQAEDLAST